MFLVEWWKTLTATPISGPPRLPEDLEREIFLLAASDAARGTLDQNWGVFQTGWSEPTRTSIPALMRVAKRTHLWLEPLLYRVLVLLDYTDNAKFIKDRLKNKPPHIWRDGPRYLFLALGDESPNVAVMKELLGKCTGIQDLNFYPPDDHPRAFLPLLDAMKSLRILSTELQALFDDSIHSIDLSRPAFAGLTHLMLFDDLQGCSEADGQHLAPQLALLPHLTNLALVGSVPQHVVLAILSTSDDTNTPLRVLVNRRQDLRRWTVQTLYERELSAVQDVRFVIMPFGVWVGEWEDAARGMKVPFWVEAERFVEWKRRKEIPAERFWTDEDMTV
ncbi:hypothetical protein C8F01DRAFT_1106414 [Mycena amicta]|nr:hypothetical protein C8F01DRAFT_1106414 [Mycena amicta]